MFNLVLKNTLRKQIKISFQFIYPCTIKINRVKSQNLAFKLQFQGKEEESAG